MRVVVAQDVFVEAKIAGFFRCQLARLPGGPCGEGAGAVASHGERNGDRVAGVGNRDLRIGEHVPPPPDRQHGFAELRRDPPSADGKRQSPPLAVEAVEPEVKGDPRDPIFRR